MYKNFRVGGGIVLGLSALVLSLAACTAAIDRNSDNNVKRDAADFTVGLASYTLCKGLEDLNESDSYVISVQYNETEYFMCDYNSKGYKTVERDKKTENANVSTISFIGSGSSYKIKNNEKFLSVQASNTLGNVYENSATVWTVEYKNNYFNFTATDSKKAKRYVAYNKDVKEIRGYTTPSDTAVITFNVYKYSIDESNPALNLRTNTDVSFEYKYLSEESGSILTGVSKNGDLSGEISNGGSFEYSLNGTYADMHKYVNKMSSNGSYITYTFLNPVSSATIKFSYKVFTALDSRFDVYCYSDINDDSLLGVYECERITGSGDDVVADYVINIPEEYKNIKRLKLVYVRTSGNIGVGAVTFSGIEGTKITAFTDVFNAKINIGYTDTYIDKYETGIIITAKENFTINQDLVPSDYPYIHVSYNSKKVEDFYVSLSISDAKKYLNTKIYYAPIIKKDSLIYFGELKVTSLKEEISKISNTIIRDYALDYLGE